MAKKLIDIRLDVKGLAELERDLVAIGRDVGLKGLSRATAAGARVLRDQARKNAPVDTGKLKKNIVVQKYRRVANKDVETRHAVVVRAKGKASDKRNAFYAYFVEHGTSRMPAQPFMRPAFEVKKGEAVDRVITSMEKTIEKEKKTRGF